MPKPKTKTTTDEPKVKKKKQRSKTPSFYNAIHKKLVVLYGSEFKDMRELWKHVRRQYRKDGHKALPKSLRKHPEEFQKFESWVDTQITSAHKQEQYFINKSDLKTRGWNERIIEQLYPKPDYKLYLGRGRWAYYYDGWAVGEREDSDEFIEYVAKKVARQQRLSAKKTNGFGSEFIR